MTTFSQPLEDYYTSDCFDWDQSHSFSGSEYPERVSGRDQSFSFHGTLVLLSVVVAAVLLGIALG
jgi:hypothetical protein